MRRIRRAQRMTQEQLAEHANLHPNYVSSVERAERNISIHNIERIALALGVTMAELVSAQGEVAESEFATETPLVREAPAEESPLGTIREAPAEERPLGPSTPQDTESAPTEDSVP